MVLVGVNPENSTSMLKTFAGSSTFSLVPSLKNQPPAAVPFVDVTSTLERKLDSFAHYATEVRDYPHPRSEQAIRAAAAFYGASCGCEAAEPFVLVRGLGL